VIVFFTVAVLAVYGAAFYKVQIYDAAAASGTDSSLPLKMTTVKQTIYAKRGDILDRNGKVLVTSRPIYNIVLSRDALLLAGDVNESLRSVIRILVDNGCSYTDTFPLTKAAPFEYLLDMTATQQSRLSKYFDYFSALRKEPDMSASDFIIWLREHYNIPYTMGMLDARLVIGVRYELEIRAIVNITPYSFANDVPEDVARQIEELACPGVYVEVSSAREFNTQFAAQLLGYIGKITESQAEKYAELGYPMDAYVGQDGAEAAFETELHGIDGERVVRVDENGAIVAIVSETPAVPGNNVYLTIDIDMQEAAERQMEILIETINSERREAARDEDGNITGTVELATGGAVVVTDVNTGEILALASNPSFDPQLYYDDYGSLLSNSSAPLFNRATQGTYAPGSTFKMVTAYAGLDNGVITRNSLIYDSGFFEKYNTAAGLFYHPRCWYYNITGHGHGYENVIDALADSCNVFFYTVADFLGMRKLNDAAYSFGFGQKTGIELPEKTGVVADEQYKISIGQGSWVAGDTVQGGIGQGLSVYTPLQLANYTAMIAADGVRYRMTLLHSVKSADYSTVLQTHVPEVVEILENKEAVDILQEGMRAVVTYRNGTAYSGFKDYKIQIAAKTGSVQSEGATTDNGCFVAYAPYNNPQIAIAVVVEKGGSGSRTVEVTKRVLDEYFESLSEFSPVGEGELIP